MGNYLDDKGFALQLSIRLGPQGQHMLNVRGSDPQEFAENCQMAEQLAGNLIQLGELFNPPADPPTEAEAIATVQNTLGGEVIGKTCAHGPMVYKTGESRGGKAWKAWMCNSRGRDKCDPVWV